MWRAHVSIPSAWNPQSLDGAARRSQLLAQPGGPTLLKASDALRKHILEQYSELLPRALDALPTLLVDGVAADMAGVAEFYGFQKFAEVWLSLRSRSFKNDAYGITAPLICLMNHPVGLGSNVDAAVVEDRGIVIKAKQPIGKGAEMLYSYGDGLCRERALLVYGFAADGMPTCEGF